ncbi:MULTISPECIES: hypothetical protein [Leisingera]|uniref:Uncharacterized protein n=1 Tax=Leisingera caerulea TaxID=506591 RepID=A0A9Q9M222_LEICA|nr:MULTISPECIES: hypothetical protein [Leisingera]MCB4454992.1 hypothetical protein [Leisingera sp. McT4-56]UWQ53109.1 hypothetical protein K3721_13970 [Leisingera caerulea]
MTIILVALAFSFAANFTSAMAMHMPHQESLAEEASPSSHSGSGHSLHLAAPSQSLDLACCANDQVSSRCIGSSCFSSDLPSAAIPSAAQTASSLHLKAGAGNFGVHLETPPPVRPPKHV